MDEVSLQPAAGAQGELAGVLMIRAYHLARGERRNKVLIPDSAHGTNPASTALAGYSVVQLKSDDERRGGSGRPRASPRRGRGGVHDHPAQHARPLRVAHPPDHGDVPRQGRAGLHGRRQLQRDPRDHAARRSRLRRLPLQPAQDLHHAARRRRAGRGAGGDQVAPGAVPADAGGGAEGRRRLRARLATGRSPSASSRPSGATSACSSAPTRTSARWAPTGSARSPTTRCSTPTTS